MPVSDATNQRAPHVCFHVSVDVSQAQHAAIGLRYAAFDDNEARHVVRPPSGDMTGHHRRGPDGEQRNPLETERRQHGVEILGEGVER